MSVLERQSSVREFTADPAHRRLYGIVVLTVLVTVAACGLSIMFIPVRYCNYLIPSLLGTSLLCLMFVARRYIKKVTNLIEQHGLLCSQCGHATIPRPDEVSLRTSGQLFGVEICYNCDSDLTTDADVGADVGADDSDAAS